MSNEHSSEGGAETQDTVNPHLAGYTKIIGRDGKERSVADELIEIDKRVAAHREELRRESVWIYVKIGLFAAAILVARIVFGN